MHAGATYVGSKLFLIPQWHEEMVRTWRARKVSIIELHHGHVGSGGLQVWLGCAKQPAGLPH